MTKFKPLYITLGLTVFVITSLVVLCLVAADQIHLRLERTGREQCPTCELSVRNVSALPLLLGRIEVHGASWKSGSAGALEISAAAHSVSAQLNVFELLQKKLTVEKILIAGLEVGITDGESKEPQTQPEEADSTHEVGEESWTIVVHEVQTRAAEFKYVRNKKGTHADLNVHNIDLQTGAMGFQKEWLDLPVKAKAELRLEKSGKIDLIVTAYMKKPLRADVELLVKGQNLSDLSPFFVENAGVALSGELINGRGSVRVQGDQAEAEVMAKYRDLKVTLNETYDRNEWTAFLMNLGTSIGMSDQSTGKPVENQVRRKKLTREPGEPIIGFILRGMKEAAISVTLAP